MHHPLIALANQENGIDLMERVWNKRRKNGEGEAESKLFYICRSAIIIIIIIIIIILLLFIEW